MIFLTLGTMEMPFDRIIKIVDNAVGEGLITDEVYGQIGYCNYKPKNFSYHDFIDKIEFDNILNKANVVISHAGMGSILQALDNNKNIIIFPRLEKYGEHVNNHQLNTANKFLGKKQVYPFFEESEFPHILREALRSEDKEQNPCSVTSDNILQHITTEIGSISKKSPTIIAGASSGGHLTQLLKILHDNDDRKIEIDTYLTTLEIVKDSLSMKGQVEIIGECNRNTKFDMIKTFFKAARLSRKLKPNVVISTGALPIAMFCFWSRLFRAKIIWIDSIANIDKISLSGRLIKPFTTLFITQWPELQSDKVKYYGSVI